MADGSKAPNSGTSVFDEAVRGILRRPGMLLAALAASAALAGGAAYFFGKERHICEGKVVFIPNTATSPYYQSPRLSSLMQVALSPSLLQDVCKECNIDDDISTLRRKLIFDIAETDTLTITLARETEEEAESVINSLMNRFVDETAELRRDALSRYLAGFERDAERARERYENALAKQQTFLTQHRFGTPEAIRDRSQIVQQTITDLELTLQTAQTQISAAQAKRDHLLGNLEKGKEGQQVVANKLVTLDPTDEAAETAINLASGRENDVERRMVLRDQIRYQQEASTYAARLRIKKDELQRAQALREKNLISQAEVDKVEGELALLEAEQNATIQKMMDAVRAIESRMAERGKLGGTLSLVGSPLDDSTPLLDAASSPAAMAALFDLDILGINEQTKQIEKALADKKREFAEIVSLQKEFVPLSEDVRRSADEWDKLQDLKENFRHAAESNIGEVTIVQPAAPAFESVASNRSKVFAAVLLCGMVVFTGPQFVAELRKASGKNLA